MDWYIPIYFFFMRGRPPNPPLFPYTTLFRSSYNQKQSMITVGAGQLRGVGPNASSQVNGHFLPASSTDFAFRSEEHTSELQSHVNLVCRLLLEKKNRKIQRCNLVRADVVKHG